MYCIDDMRGCIQDWFSDAANVNEVARTYCAILMESEKQLEFMMEERTRNGQIRTIKTRDSN